MKKAKKYKKEWWEHAGRSLQIVYWSTLIVFSICTIAAVIFDFTDIGWKKSIASHFPGYGDICNQLKDRMTNVWSASVSISGAVTAIFTFLVGRMRKGLGELSIQDVLNLPFPSVSLIFIRIATIIFPVFQFICLTFSLRYLFYVCFAWLYAYVFVLSILSVLITSKRFLNWSVWVGIEKEFKNSLSNENHSEKCLLARFWTDNRNEEFWEGNDRGLRGLLWDRYIKECNWYYKKADKKPIVFLEGMYDQVYQIYNGLSIQEKGICGSAYTAYKQAVNADITGHVRAVFSMAFARLCFEKKGMRKLLEDIHDSYNLNSLQLYFDLIIYGEYSLLCGAPYLPKMQKLVLNEELYNESIEKELALHIYILLHKNRPYNVEVNKQMLDLLKDFKDDKGERTHYGKLKKWSRLVKQ